MKNCGPVSRQWLSEIGIYSVSDLKRAGVVTTYKILKERYPRVSHPTMVPGSASDAQVYSTWPHNVRSTSFSLVKQEAHICAA